MRYSVRRNKKSKKTGEYIWYKLQMPRKNTDTVIILYEEAHFTD